MWNPWRRVTAVVVRASGFAYACRRDVEEAWRCGRCERGVIQHPEIGRRCVACEAEVVAVQRGRDLWVMMLVVLILVATWAALTWWR
jgi:Zn finger protein HypA/HybF involved in hydrogenase expression